MKSFLTLAALALPLAASGQTLEQIIALSFLFYILIGVLLMVIVVKVIRRFVPWARQHPKTTYAIAIIIVLLLLDECKVF